ncbi:MAG: LysR substrate-binding domain-containing protein [Thiolinea sp.]
MDQPGFTHLCIAEDQLVPVSAVDAQQRPLFSLRHPPRQPLPYIAYHASSFMAPLMKFHLAQQQQVQLATLNENRHAVSVVAMIREGFGLGWVPQRLVQRDLDEGLLALAGDADWCIPLEVRLYRGPGMKNQDMQRLWDALAAT